MKNVRSRVTAQGQISVPAEVRKRLGIAPGSILEWHEVEGGMVVRKAARYSFLDVHNLLFGADEPPAPLADVKEGVRQYIRLKHGRR